MLKKVISVCTLSDLDMWVFAHPYILKYIESEVYELIVPDEYLAEFSECTHSSYKVTPESYYIDLQTINNINTTIQINACADPKVYIKQILNIEASISCLNDEDSVLFLATDTVPINKVKFIYDDSLRNYSICSESNLPVCLTMGRLNKSGEQVPNHCDLIDIIPTRWNKFGTSLFDIGNSDTHNCMHSLSKYYDFISFEKEDTSKFKGINIGCGNIRIEKTYLSNRMLNVDIENLPSVDAVLDCNDQKWFFLEAQFEHIVINNVLEHCNSVLSVMLELDRILIPGGILQFEVPFMGSYNHATDITHVRGFTFNSFDFLFKQVNYLYRYQEVNPFNYNLIQFWREDTNDLGLIHESFTDIPAKSEWTEWLHKISRYEIPGTFGYIFQKLSKYNFA